VEQLLRTATELINVVDKEGKTVLHWAAYGGNEEIIEITKDVQLYIGLFL